VLVELTVRDLGVIDDLTLVLGPGMTAVTGETGAGKTLVVEAIELLVGGRPDAVMVRPGAAEAWVEGRFTTDDGEEVILARAIPGEGRSRAYVDGRMAPVASLAEWGARLVDLHGQHAHQSLLAPAVQRGALDAFAGVDRGPLEAARARVRAADEALAELGGDARARAREVDLLRYQMGELEAAHLDDPHEDVELERREAVLAQAGAWRAAAAAAHEAIEGDGGASEAVGGAVALLRGRGAGVTAGSDGGPFAAVAERLAAVAAELSDVALDLRDAGESIPDDPGELAAVQARRHALRELRRKYGETLADVIAYTREVGSRLAELESYEERAATIEAERSRAEADMATAAAEIAACRRAAAPRLAQAVARHLHDLALPRTGASRCCPSPRWPPEGSWRARCSRPAWS